MAEIHGRAQCAAPACKNIYIGIDDVCADTLVRFNMIRASGLYIITVVSVIKQVWSMVTDYFERIMRSRALIDSL